MLPNRNYPGNRLPPPTRSFRVVLCQNGTSAWWWPGDTLGCHRCSIKKPFPSHPWFFYPWFSKVYLESSTCFIILWCIITPCISPNRVIMWLSHNSIIIKLTCRICLLALPNNFGIILVSICQMSITQDIQVKCQNLCLRITPWFVSHWHAPHSTTGSKSRGKLPVHHKCRVQQLGKPISREIQKGRVGYP